MSNGAQGPDTEAVALESEDEAVPSPTPDRLPSLPGKVKGRHEHPGRSRSIKADPHRETQSSSPSPFADESGAGTRFGELQRRVPGEALTFEQEEELARDGRDGPFGRDSFESDHPARFADEKPAEASIVEQAFPATAESEHGSGVEVEPVAEDQEGVDEATAVEETPHWTDSPVTPPPTEKPWWAAKESSADKVEEPAPPHLELVQPDPLTDDGLEQDGPAESQETPAASSLRDPVQSKITPVGLPVRTPGVSFRDPDESMTSSTASKSGAIGIKSALTEFSDGRSLASQKLDERDGAEESADEDPVEGRDE
jgi:hypothetical protein